MSHQLAREMLFFLIHQTFVDFFSTAPILEKVATDTPHKHAPPPNPLQILWDRSRNSEGHSKGKKTLQKNYNDVFHIRMEHVFYHKEAPLIFMGSMFGIVSGQSISKRMGSDLPVSTLYALSPKKMLLHEWSKDFLPENLACRHLDSNPCLKAATVLVYWQESSQSPQCSFWFTYLRQISQVSALLSTLAVHPWCWCPSGYTLASGWRQWTIGRHWRKEGKSKREEKKEKIISHHERDGFQYPPNGS